MVAAEGDTRGGTVTTTGFSVSGFSVYGFSERGFADAPREGLLVTQAMLFPALSEERIL